MSEIPPEIPPEIPREAPPETREPGIAHEWDEFNLKFVDRCEYLGIVMKNDMKCMVVKDPNAYLASVSVSVNVGNLDNPNNYDGLAHFVEHLVMHQTIQCTERKFYKFIGKFGGQCNANTDDDRTYYHFRVPSDHLEESLKQFFKLFNNELTFTDEMLNYELSAVDSEFRETMTTHGQRRVRTVQLAGNNTNRKHPANRFYKGNKKALAICEELKQKCKEFRKKHLQPWNMNISIISNCDCENVKNWIEETFVQIEHSLAFPSERSTLPMYSFVDGATTIPETISFCPNGPDRMNRLDLVFINGDSTPLDFLEYLLSSRGPGSLFHELRAKLHFEPAKSGATCREAGTFSFCLARIDPFNDAEKWSAVVLVFQYLEALKKWVNNRNGQEYKQLVEIFDQSIAMSNVRFNFGELAGADYARLLNEHLNGTFDKFNRNLFVDNTQNDANFGDQSHAFAESLYKLRMDKMHIIVMRNEHPTADPNVQIKLDNIYKLNYCKINRQQRIGIANRIQTDEPNFKVPSTSSYFPERVQLEEMHREVHDQPNSTTITTFGGHSDWMFFNKRSPVLKIGILLRRDTSTATLTDEQYILFRIYINEFVHSNSSLSDEAKFASIDFDFEVDAHGIQITIYGFKDNLINKFVKCLVGAFCGHANKVRIDDNEFKRSKKELNNDLKYPGGSVKDELLARMYNLLGQRRLVSSVSAQVTPVNMINETKHFLSNCTIKLFVCGNTTNADCISLRQTCEQQFIEAFPGWCSRVQPKLVRPEVKLRAVKPTFYEGEGSLDRATNGYLVFHQIVTSQMKDFALLALLRFMLKPEFSEKFRYSEKHPPAGYTSSLVHCLNSHSIGLAMVLQPDGAHHFECCYQMVESLITDFQGILNGLNADSFATTKKCLLDSIRDNINRNAFDYYWPMFKLNDDFVDTPTFLATIQSTTKEELNIFFGNHFKTNAPSQCRRLAVMLQSFNVRAAAGSLAYLERLRRDGAVTDIARFVETSEMCANRLV